MSIEKGIPSIYASIGNREDVNVNPTRADSVASVLQSTQAVAYRNSRASFSKEASEYVTSLEVALRDALSDQFLADRIRELANDPVAMQGRGEIWGDVLRLVALKLAPPQSL
jgi:hypothetical protein